MSIESRRATVQRLIVSEGIAGRSIGSDMDFLSLAEQWVSREIDMPEMRRLYQAGREERRKQKLNPNPTPSTELFAEEPQTSSDEQSAEIARFAQSDFNE